MTSPSHILSVLMFFNLSTIRSYVITEPYKLKPTKWAVFTIISLLHVAAHLGCYQGFSSTRMREVVFIHFIVCLRTASLPLPKRALHRVRDGASSFTFHYPLLSLSPSSTCLRLLPRLPFTSIFLSKSGLEGSF
jgi:hypothetical protein